MKKPATTESIKAALWERGEILWWKLHGGQLLIENKFQQSRGRTKGKLFVADCSRQLGKTTWAVAKSIEVAMKKPRARIRYGTAFLDDLIDFVIPAFDLILQDCPDHLKPRWLAQRSAFVFPNGSIIRLVGLDRNPNKLRGNRLAMVVIEEAGFVARLGYLYRFVIIPSMTHVPDGIIAMISTQPEAPDHEFVEFCDRAEEAGAYICLDVYQNPMLTPEKIDEIAIECAPPTPGLAREQKIAMGKASTAFRREYLCQRIVESERAIIPEFAARHVTPSPICDAHKFWRRLESLDSGVRDKTACLFAYYDFARAKLCIEDEYAIQGSEVTTRRIAQLTREKENERGYTFVFRRVADNDNLILLQDLGTEFDLHFAPTDKDELPAMVNKVRLWFGSDRIEIHPRCQQLIGALKAGIWNKNRDAFDRSAKHGHFDLIASLVYMVRNVPVHDNPVPQYFGQNVSEVIFRTPHDKLSSGATTLKRALTGGN